MTPGRQPLDTTPEAHAIQVEAYRGMGGRGRTAVMFRLNDLARQVTLAGIRGRHPDYTERQALQALRRLMLGDELTRAVWPEHPLVEP
jgi:hypothetical protein